MTIFFPYNIVHYETVDTTCPECGYSAHQSDLLKKAKLALVATTQYVRAATELRLLRKTQDLFARFPNSRHPYVVDKLNLKVGSEPDPEIEAELEQDPELRNFLNPDHGFYLPARLKVCEKTEQKTPPPESSREDIACPQCSHFRILPEDFYYMVGMRRPE